MVLIKTLVHLALRMWLSGKLQSLQVYLVKMKSHRNKMILWHNDKGRYKETMGLKRDTKRRKACEDRQRLEWYIYSLSRVKTTVDTRS